MWNSVFTRVGQMGKSNGTPTLPTLSGGIGLSGRHRPGAQSPANTRAGKRKIARITVITANLFNLIVYTVESPANSGVHKVFGEKILPLRRRICQCKPDDIERPSAVAWISIGSVRGCFSSAESLLPEDSVIRFRIAALACIFPGRSRTSHFLRNQWRL